MARHSVRNAIQQSGMKLFTERGFNGSSVQDITDAAGVPKGSFYNHFKSKEALAAEILTAYGDGMTDRDILTDPGVPALTRLKKHFAALNEYFSRCTDGCLVGKFMAEVSDETPEIRKRLLSVLRVWGEQISSAIADGQKEGSIRKDLKADDLAAFLIDAFGPDLCWTVQDIKVVGDQIIVRGRATGTPTGEFWGVKPTGKSFDTMAIDVFTVRSGKLASAYHVENWVGALEQIGS